MARHTRLDSADADSEEPNEEEPFLFSPCVTTPPLDDEPEVTQRKCATRWPVWLAGGLGVAIALWTAKRHIGDAIMWLAKLAESAGWWGVAGTVICLSLWVVALMPITPFEVLIGHVFPLKTAIAVAIVGKTLGACACFAISQQAKPYVERLLRKHHRLRALSRTVHAHPLKATVMVRFSMLPAPIKNYAWPSLGVDFGVFFLATLAEAPMYATPPVLLGSHLSDLADLAAGRQRIRPNPFLLAFGGGMLLLLVVLGATSQRWLEAEQSAMELSRLDADAEKQLVPRSPDPERRGAPGAEQGTTN